MAENEITKPGDCTIFTNYGGHADISKIDEAGEQERVRNGIKAREDADRIALKNLESDDRAPVSDDSTPDVCAKLGFHDSPLRFANTV